MFRKASPQEALLSSPDNAGLDSSSSQMFGEFIADESFVEMRFTASCEGVFGTAKIYNDGSFTFNSHMASTPRYILHLTLQYFLHGYHQRRLHSDLL